MHDKSFTDSMSPADEGKQEARQIISSNPRATADAEVIVDAWQLCSLCARLSCLAVTLPLFWQMAMEL